MADMALAASKVYAIQELLEQILLERVTTIQDLFVLQCVNRSSRRAITFSPALRGRMFLQHPSPTSSRATEASKLYSRGFNPYIRMLLQGSPHSFSGGSARSGSGCSIHITTSTIALDAANASKHEYGLHGLEKSHSVTQSWSQMKLSFTSLPARIKIDLESYQDIITLEPQEATLGNLIKVLEEIQGRGAEGHTELIRTQPHAPRPFVERRRLNNAESGRPSRVRLVWRAIATE